MSETPLAYFCRHGATTLNQKNCFRGPLDIPLAEQGVREAHELKAFFKSVPYSVVVASPRQRAMHTAQIIVGDRAILPNEGLYAWNVGHLAGQEKDPENVAEIAHYVANPDESIPGGESLSRFRERVRPLIADAAEIGFNTGIPPLVVAHSSVIHEVGEFINGSHSSTLVKPGGAVAVYWNNGKITAKPIFKPDLSAMRGRRADVIT